MTTMTVRSISISAVSTRSDARQVDAKAVAGLVDSIAAVGLINPIRVRPASDGFEVIAGAHRLAACRELGLADIDCIVVDADDLHAELAMIDENLCRAELSAADRATQTARRKVIYEELHPETRQHVAGAAGRWGATANSATAFAEATAKVSGISERAVRRDAERGAKVIPEVLEMLRGTRLDTGAYLDSIKNFSANDQVTAARRDLRLDRQQHEERTAGRTLRAAASIDADVKQRAAKEAAEVISGYVPADAWDGLKANLYAAGAKAVADALTNITGQSIMDRRAS